MKKPIAIAIICGLAVLFACCSNSLDVLGPRDKPKLVSDQWDQIQVKYWIFTEGQEDAIERSFTISDPTSIDDLKTRLQIRKTDGLSIGCGSQLVFKNQDTEIWHGDFVFEDTIYLASSKDAWRSYKFVLDDTSFYKEMRVLCARNETKYHPKATWENIKLRSNLRFNYPKL